MDTTTEALDALSEALAPELRRPWIWAPCGAVALITELIALRCGYSPATELYRYMWHHKPLRYAFLAWSAITGAHLHRIGPQRLDIYSFVDRNLVQYGKNAANQARRDLERARSA